MLFYTNILINTPIHHPSPLTGERDGSFWRYNVSRCISKRKIKSKDSQITKFYSQKNDHITVP